MDNKIPQKNTAKINALCMRINALYDVFNDELLVMKNKIKALESNILELKIKKQEEQLKE